MIECSWLTFYFYINSDIVILVKWSSCIPAIVFVSKSAVETPLPFINEVCKCLRRKTYSTNLGCGQRITLYKKFIEKEASLSTEFILKMGNPYV